MNRIFFEKVQSLEYLFEKVAALENSQVAFNLLKFCLGVCKVNNMSRVTPAECCMAGGKLYDTLVEEALRTMVGGTLDTAIFKELQLLPTKTTSPEVRTLGLGLTSAFTTAPSAFFPPLRAAMPLSDLCLVATLRLHSRHMKERQANMSHGLINVRNTPPYRSLLSTLNDRRNNTQLRHSFLRNLQAHYTCNLRS